MAHHGQRILSALKVHAKVKLYISDAHKPVAYNLCMNIVSQYTVMKDVQITSTVKKQPSQDVLQGDTAEEELGLACLVSSYTLPHQNSQPGGRGWQTAHSKVLSRRAKDT